MADKKWDCPNKGDIRCIFNIVDPHSGDCMTCKADPVVVSHLIRMFLGMRGQAHEMMGMVAEPSWHAGGW